MIKLGLPDIAAAETEVRRTGESILTIYTALNNEVGSSDWRAFNALRSSLQSLIGAERGYNEIRIKTLEPAENEERVIGVNDLGDPIV